MRVAERYASKSEMISDLSATALYELAVPSTPEEVRAEVERRIGELMAAQRETVGLS